MGLGSCSNKSETSDVKVIAKVFDKKLLITDLENIVSAGVSPKDSAILVQKFIDKWVEDELVLHYAENNLTAEQKDIEKQLENTRKSLIIHAYQTELISQKLDTTVSAAEIEKYYAEHPQNFQLKDDIVKVCYVKVNKKAPNIDKVKKWYASSDAKDLEQLQSYCIQFAENFFIDQNTWLLFDDLIKEVPINNYNSEMFLKNNRLIEVSDSTNLYFLNIKGFMIKNGVSPLSFERDNIKNTIINQRKIKLIEDMKRTVYDEAKENGNFEIYTGNEKK